MFILYDIINLIIIVINLPVFICAKNFIPALAGVWGYTLRGMCFRTRSGFMLSL